MGPTLVLVAPRVRVGSGKACDVRAEGLRDVHLELALGEEGWEAIAHGEVLVGDVELLPGERRLVHAGLAVRAGEHAWTLAEPALDPGLATRALALQQAGRWADDRRGAVVRVLVAQGPDRGRLLDLTDEGRTYWLGRGRDASLALTDASLSRRHAGVVRGANGAVRVRDAESSAGTFVGRQRLPPAAFAVWPEERMVRLGRTVLALIVPIAARELPLPDVAPAAPVPAPTAAPPDPPAVAAEAPKPAIAAPIAQVRSEVRARSGPRPPPAWAMAVGLALLTAVGALAFWYVLR